MSGNALRGVALFAVAAILAVEGFLVYRFYHNLPSSPANGGGISSGVSATSGASSSSPAALEATEHETTDGFESTDPTSSDKSIKPARKTENADPDGPSIASVFVHRATPENSRGDYTYLDDPAANGDPDAVLLVTGTVDREDGVYNARNIGVWYEPRRQRWAIFNQNRTAIPAGTTFNVVVLRTARRAVHRATSANTVAYSTYLDHPLANGNPDAVLTVTPNWNPGGGGGTYNDHPVGVRYDADRRRWAVFNKDRAAIPPGAVFNIGVWRNSS